MPCATPCATQRALPRTFPGAGNAPARSRSRSRSSSPTTAGSAGRRGRGGLRRFTTRLLIAALTLLPLVAVAAAPADAQDQQQSASAPPTASTYTLGPGDRVKVTVFGHEDLSGEFEVDGTGLIAMPLIKEVEAANLTARQLEGSIADHLEPEYLRNPRVSVEVLTYRPFYIIGEIKEPGSYPYVSGMTAWNAVALAGGFTYRAKTGFVLLRRGSGDAQRVPLDAQVRPGDVIEVAERFW